MPLPLPSPWLIRYLHYHVGNGDRRSSALIREYGLSGGLDYSFPKLVITASRLHLYGLIMWQSCVFVHNLVCLQWTGGCGVVWPHLLCRTADSILMYQVQLCPPGEEEGYKETHHIGTSSTRYLHFQQPLPLP